MNQEENNTLKLFNFCWYKTDHAGRLSWWLFINYFRRISWSTVFTSDHSCVESKQRTLNTGAVWSKTSPSWWCHYEQPLVGWAGRMSRQWSILEIGSLQCLGCWLKYYMNVLHNTLVGPNYVEIDIDVDINQIMLAGRVASQAGCMSC